MTSSTSIDGAEHARLDPAHALGEKRGAERLVQRLGELGSSGSGHARPVSARGVAVERELRDDERGAADIEQAPIEAPGVVREDAESSNPSCYPAGPRDVIVVPDPEQHDEPGADRADHGAAHANLGPRHPLHQGSHIAEYGTFARACGVFQVDT